MARKPQPIEELSLASLCELYTEDALTIKQMSDFAHMQLAKDRIAEATERATNVRQLISVKLATLDKKSGIKSAA